MQYQIPLYCLFRDRAKIVRVIPCLSYAEAALIEWACTQGMGSEFQCVEAERFKLYRGKGLRSPEILRQAAELAAAKRVKNVRSYVGGSPRQHLISATARKLLEPPHLKSTNELLKEQARVRA